jgi:hypothetical protein
LLIIINHDNEFCKIFRSDNAVGILNDNLKIFHYLWEFLQASLSKNLWKINHSHLVTLDILDDLRHFVLSLIYRVVAAVAHHHVWHMEILFYHFLVFLQVTVLDLVVHDLQSELGVLFRVKFV